MSAEAEPGSKTSELCSLNEMSSTDHYREHKSLFESWLNSVKVNSAYVTRTSLQLIKEYPGPATPGGPGGPWPPHFLQGKLLKTNFFKQNI